MNIANQKPEARNAAELQERNNTSQVMAMCRDWLSDCFNNHEVCRQRVGTNENRLLDTGSPGEPPSLRLVVSNNLKHASTPYLALTHCWGSWKSSPYGMPISRGYKRVFHSLLFHEPFNMPLWRHERSGIDTSGSTHCVSSRTPSKIGNMKLH